MSKPPRSSLLVLISGPSGAGKSTVLGELIKRHPDWRVVRSYTTRAERKEESTVKPYYFVSVDEFMSLIKTGQVLEYEQYAGNWYGTSTASLEESMREAPVVLMDLQLKGIADLKERYPQALDVYIRLGLAEARRRLMADWRRTNVPRREMLSRLANVARQNRRARKFAVVVDSLPGDIQGTVDMVERAILFSARS